jgi:hypothetical protein
MIWLRKLIVPANKFGCSNSQIGCSSSEIGCYDSEIDSFAKNVCSNSQKEGIEHYEGVRILVENLLEHGGELPTAVGENDAVFRGHGVLPSLRPWCIGRRRLRVFHRRGHEAERESREGWSTGGLLSTGRHIVFSGIYGTEMASWVQFWKKGQLHTTYNVQLTSYVYCD